MLLFNMYRLFIQLTENWKTELIDAYCTKQWKAIKRYQIPSSSQLPLDVVARLAGKKPTRSKSGANQ